MASWHGDLCKSKHCGDLAHPGNDLCINCIADRQAEREITAAAAAVVTAQHEAAGFADAPWPPQYEKQANEPPRVQPSKKRGGPPTPEGIVPPPAPGKTAGPTGRRRTSMPLIEIARAATEKEALEGLERWKVKHPAVVPHLEPADVMVDSMRGRSTTWTRIRVNLRNVPDEERPAQEALEVDYDPWEGVVWPGDATEYTR